MKRFYLFFALVSAYGVSQADSLDTLVNDTGKRVVIIEQNATCNLKPNTICNAAIASCSAGRKIIPGLSKCELTDSNGYNLSWLLNTNTDLKSGQQICNINNNYYGYSSPGDVNIKSIAACATIPKILPSLLKKINVGNPYE